MNAQPTIYTDRLVLRPFSLEDAEDVQCLAGDWDIAATTLSIPHPYERGMAESWISTHHDEFIRGRKTVFAVAHRELGELLGAVSLTLRRVHRCAELGYWIGKPYWNHGYATEAAIAAIHYGFRELHLHRIYATHLGRNPASGRVMTKAGMHREGNLREHVLKWGAFDDLVTYGVLACEYPSVGCSK
jgi:RimJ/RimL family protein N-acetyltransferase